MVIFHSYVSLQEGNSLYLPQTSTIQLVIYVFSERDRTQASQIVKTYWILPVIPWRDP